MNGGMQLVNNFMQKYAVLRVMFGCSCFNLNYSPLKSIGKIRSDCIGYTYLIGGKFTETSLAEFAVKI